MEMYFDQCSICGKWFKVKEASDGFAGGKLKEEIICPYCKAENGAIMTDGRVLTEKIEPQPQISKNNKLQKHTIHYEKL